MGLYVRKHSGGWSVIEESYSNGQRSQKTIPKESYVSLGINPDWDVSKAKAEAKRINLAKHATSTRIKAARNYASIMERGTVYTPGDQVRDFLQKLIEDSFGSDRHKNRLLSHWQYLSRMLIKLQIQPVDYFDNKERIYKYFIEQRTSPDYANKLLRVLNAWGEFTCRDRKQFFQPVRRPRGLIRSKIEESYLDSDKVKSESEPLTPELLYTVHTVLRPCNYNWLLMTVWFGLRPNEVDLKKLKVGTIDGLPVLSVYQTKLTSVARDKRWKIIPAIYPPQIELAEKLNTLEFKRPLMKTLRRVFKQRITLYGGRKGFVDLMLDRGQSLEDISMWLGHQSIETTWRKYRNRKRVSWKTG